MEAGPARLVDALSAEEQQLAYVVERVTFPAPMLDGVLLDPLATASHGHVGEADDVKRVDHHRHPGQRRRRPGDAVGAGDGAAVALMRVDRHDLHVGQPGRRRGGHPSSQVLGVAAFEDVEDLPGAHVDHRGHEPATPPPMGW